VSWTTDAFEQFPVPPRRDAMPPRRADCRRSSIVPRGRCLSDFGTQRSPTRRELGNELHELLRHFG
jgi:hypothetical protein